MTLLLLDPLLPPHPIFGDDTLELSLSTFLALEIPGVPQTSCLAPSAIQTSCLLWALALVGGVGGGWGLGFHRDDAVRAGKFPHIASWRAWSCLRMSEDALLVYVRCTYSLCPVVMGPKEYLIKNGLSTVGATLMR